MERSKLLQLISESLTEEQRSNYLTDEIIDSIEQETDEVGMLSQAEKVLTEYFSGEFNLVEYNLNASREYLQLCIIRRKELKDLEVLIINQAAQRKTLFLKRIQDAEIRNTQLFYKSIFTKQLSRQLNLQFTTSMVSGDEQSQNQIQQYDKEIEEIISKYRIELENIEDQVVDLGVNESSGMDYLSRYQQLKISYKNGVIALYKTLQNLSLGLTLIYRIFPNNQILKVPKPRPNYFLYDCNVWLQKLSEIINKKQASLTYMSRTIYISEFYQSALDNLRNFGDTKGQMLFSWNDHIHVDTISIIFRDSESDSKKDLWGVKISIGLKQQSTYEDISFYQDTINSEEWSKMLAQEKQLEYHTETSNSLGDMTFIQISPVNLKNIDSTELLISIAIRGSMNKKETKSIEDVIVVFKGYSFNPF